MSKGNEAAFAKGGAEAFDMDEGKFLSNGLSKREYFAGLAMQGLLSRIDMGSEERARYAVENANDLLAELEKTA